MTTSKKHYKGTILQILPELYTGGVERGTVDISRELVKNGYRSLILSAGGHLEHSIRRDGGKVFKLPVNTKNPFKIIANIKKIQAIIKKEKVDLVHCRSRAPAWSAYFASKRENIPFITTFHGFYKFSNFFKKWYNSIMIRGFAVIAVSEFIKEHILENYSTPVDNIKVIHRGVDLEYFDPQKVNFQRLKKLTSQYNIPEDKFILCMPGRVSSWKGHEILVKALHKVKSENFHCILPGDYTKKPKFYRKLTNMIDRFGIGRKITFCGNVSDMPAIYKLSDTIVSASIEPEAFGRVAAEGQAMQKIVIASNIGGSRETVKSDITGYLFENKNSDELASIIDKIVALSDKKRAQLGKNGRDNVKKNFSLNKMYKKTMQLYDDILDASR